MDVVNIVTSYLAVDFPAVKTLKDRQLHPECTVETGNIDDSHLCKTCTEDDYGQYPHLYCMFNLLYCGIIVYDEDLLFTTDDLQYRAKCAFVGFWHQVPRGKACEYPCAFARDVRLASLCSRSNLSGFTFARTLRDY